MEELSYCVTIEKEDGNLEDLELPCDEEKLRSFLKMGDLDSVDAKDYNCADYLNYQGAPGMRSLYPIKEVCEFNDKLSYINNAMMIDHKKLLAYLEYIGYINNGVLNDYNEDEYELYNKKEFDEIIEENVKSLCLDYDMIKKDLLKTDYIQTSHGFLKLCYHR